MSIKITAKGLEMSDPTFDELSRLKQLEQSIALAERERIIELLASNDHYSVDWLIELIKGEKSE